MGAPANNQQKGKEGMCPHSGNNMVFSYVRNVEIFAANII
jgi:hypothetical protein